MAKHLACLRAAALATLFLGALLTDSSRAAAPSVRVVPPPGNGRVPEAVVDVQGTIHLVFVDGEDVFYAKSTDNGATFGGRLRVNSDPGTAHPPNMYRGPEIAVGRNGRAHVIWYVSAYQRHLPKEQWGVHYASLDPGATRFSPARNLNHLPSDNYSLAVDQRGRVAVFWMAAGLFLSLSEDDGSTFANARKLDAAEPCECCASRAWLGEDGTLWCAYREKAGDDRDMFLTWTRLPGFDWQRKRMSSATWHINACPMTGSFLRGAGSGLVMAWETKGTVAYARVHPEGSQFSGSEIHEPATGAKWPVALANGRGEVLLSWKRGHNLEWQAFDASDKPLGEVHSTPATSSLRHAGVVTKDGAFLLFP